MNFRQEYLGEYVKDDLYEVLVEAWMAYHKAADKIDGHIRYPRDSYERRLVRMAAVAGTQARREVLEKAGIPRHKIDKDKWNRAKLEALRRLGK